MSDTRLDIERDKYLEWKEQQKEAMRSFCEDCENHNTDCPYFVLEDKEENEGYWDFEECFRDSGGGGMTREEFEQYAKENGLIVWSKEMSEKAIKALEQEPKTGHWIENAPEYQNIDPPYICSECGNMHLRKTNYCDQCGAKMVESQEREVSE